MKKNENDSTESNAELKKPPETKKQRNIRIMENINTVLIIFTAFFIFPRYLSDFANNLMSKYDTWYFYILAFGFYFLLLRTKYRELKDNYYFFQFIDTLYFYFVAFTVWLKYLELERDVNLIPIK
ncbi:hypothetical protein [Suttonella indologenes]|uniref:Uncharacterized protein n=1 Tax=Suttonella indologenes TaxID=13276 RepID=A0A380MKY4_9GAMM|nr:hypothetical protein [Suttonella indologenes]SUO92205.1 Uncharacterised protein [Suttonella indologenes]